MKRRVPIHGAENLAHAREAGKLAAEVLAMIGEHVRPGVSTEELDARCREFIIKELKSKPANIGYHGYPKTICASVNDVICHGIPSEKEILKDGDIVNIDVALIKNGWFGDSSRMYYAGTPKPQSKRLVETCYAAMRAGILAVRPGATLGDVGHAIQSVTEAAGYSVVREYCGHGIGKVYHDEPEVLHYGRQGQGLKLRPGMIFTIEPMINEGEAATRILADGWTVLTRDGSLSAQWEHMVTVTETGFEVLTAWPDGLGDYPALG
ncbi:type I methionyl aminopeptidase [Chromobacterium sp. IIBBL 290-4]|uniref:type I methionyl aminopeptidase n=1 Tax=Chromobacterium sp. IIBBL 290-4 TaxID=2953890 RepID=UPI0020B8C831|nr:type I methionyl aminopeptidase [Chromobacterium sp. IIBBL 290-4]UTH73518.1 type I methionyl aminopeptidase [Chromobacterium sp. IIBBL 290-4]